MAAEKPVCQQKGRGVRSAQNLQGKQEAVPQVRERLDSSSPSIRYVCNECLMVLGYPTQQELDKFFKE